MNEINKINKVLIVQTAFIGDVILITPLIRESKKIFSNSLIDVMVIPQTSNILENNPHINSIILFDKRNNKLKSFFRTLKLVRKNKYDLVLSPHSSFTTALIIWLASIPTRIGFARWAAQYFLTHRLPHPENILKIKKNLNMLSYFSKEKLSIQTEIFPTKEMFSKADNILLGMKKVTNKIIAVAPGSNWFTKRWPIEYYKTLVEYLNNQNYGIIFIGSKEERDICEEIKPIDKFVNTAGELSLLQSAAVISKCDLIVCNDSGAMHIANAVKTDVFVFFGPTVEKIGYFPIGVNDKVFQTDLECRPCSSHGGNKCPLEHFNCMRILEPKMVLKEIENKFN